MSVIRAPSCGMKWPLPFIPGRLDKVQVWHTKECKVSLAGSVGIFTTPTALDVIFTRSRPWCFIGFLFRVNSGDLD